MIREDVQRTAVVHVTTPLLDVVNDSQGFMRVHQHAFIHIHIHMEFLPFEDAREYARTLGLRSHEEWRAWSAPAVRPHDIPNSPDVTYASSGWTSYPDFLGYADGQGARGSFRSFEDARAFVRTLGLKSKGEWQAWSKSGARPHDIPGNPEQTYKESEWTSWGDFLGYDIGKVANTLKRKVRA
ncbi:methyltransferase domain-containing protein [Pycnococcus provasolii]